MLGIARRLLLALIVFALAGGTTSQLAHSALGSVPMTMADVPCDAMTPTAGAERSNPVMPCNGMTSDCIKQMGCVTDTALPARLAGDDIIVHVSTVDYWTAGSDWAELVREPEPLPPRTA